MDYPALLDPRTIGILSAAFNGLQASGPSLMPRSTGQIAGTAGQTGLGSYQQAAQQQQQAAFQSIHGQLYQQQIDKMRQEGDMARQLQGVLSGGANGSLSADQLEAMGARLAIGGHPGAATVIGQAEKVRAAQQAAQQVQQFQDQPQEVPVTRSSAGGDSSTLQDAIAKYRTQGGGTVAYGPDQDPAMTASGTVQQRGGGLFAPLLTSPYVGEHARHLQAQLNSAQVKGTTPQQWMQQYDKLLALHQTAANQAAGREESGALRRELAGNQDQTRRDIATMSLGAREDARANNQENRHFTQERQLSENYNALSKDFRKVLPQFQSAAQYVAAGKFDSSGDRALVFQFAKTLDPADRVGVNDVRDIQKLGNVPERIVQAVQSLAEGKMLPDRVRAEMFQVMRNRFAAMNEQQTQIEDEYNQRARGYMLRPENVVMPFAVRRGAGGGNQSGWGIKELK